MCQRVGGGQEEDEHKTKKTKMARVYVEMLVSISVYISVHIYQCRSMQVTRVLWCIP